ncbi:MAG TPA: 23S rRNA (pseudouridine(1915)-N(3))-methyltransferase RlmH [Flavitalea sp.]|nr:23S rRNA (pseudouridine(1915)-N(3))-methyltransferase RlmH [Flavitalea sp.]
MTPASRGLFNAAKKTMKLLFLAIGKTNEGYLDPGIEDYTKRVSNYFPVAWKIIPPVKGGSLSESALKKKEGLQILKLLGPQDFLVALDESGKMMNSISLSALIQSRANESTRQIVFLIGGAFGLDSTVLGKADLKWSLSALTFPHQIVRLILAEQIYRACTILRNESYHHS